MRWLAIMLVGAAALAGCGRMGGAPADRGASMTALVGGRVYPAPGTPSIADGVVLIDGASIAAVGSRADVRIPPGATVIDCAGTTVTAAFWNSHVHFTQPVWNDAATAPADRLAQGLRAMLTAYGFVRVLDTGSLPGNTDALRRRIESREIDGPAIMLASGSLVPEGGSPYYVLPARLPEAKTVAQTVAVVDAVADRGADGIKLFTGSWATPRSIVVMPAEIVRAATTAAHRRGKFVIAHPSNSAGARVAIEQGVDILAHTFPSELDRKPWDRALPAMMRERGMALIPTLKLWPYELKKSGVPDTVTTVVLGNGKAQLAEFAKLGGQVLFGTDVGYMTDYDPSDEYAFMRDAGLSFAQILAALTTAPASRFGMEARAGRLAPGFAADVVVVDGDPERDIRALGAVRSTLRAGRVVFARR